MIVAGGGAGRVRSVLVIVAADGVGAVGFPYELVSVENYIIVRLARSKDFRAFAPHNNQLIARCIMHHMDKKILMLFCWCY